jgi:hypothetical protein
MARIVIVEHPWQRQRPLAYLLYDLAALWEQAGHELLMHRGTEQPLPRADLAIAHVDLTRLPPAYEALFSGCRRVVNAAVRDISKRRFSSLLLADAESAAAWGGPVIVKSDANFGGLAERLAAQAEGLPAPRAGLDEYRVYDRAGDVPPQVWQRPDWVVERFVPERGADGRYALRIWTFFGDAERCTCYWADEPIVKGEAMQQGGPCPVPDELRALRRTLGFDFGKFDFVVHQGRALLLDANRTPMAPTAPAVRAALAASNRRLAAAVDAFVDAPAS